MDFIDDKYIGLLSPRLQKFKKVKTGLYNFRCPICGDSQKNKNKSRGYIYSVKNNTNFKCHNCGASLSFNNFLKKIDTTLHQQYAMEKFKEGKTGKNFVVQEPKFEFKKPEFKKNKVQSLDLPKASEDETAKKYLLSRKLDPEKFYFAKKFKEWVNTQKFTFDNTNYDEARIVIPLYGFDGSLIGIQGRSLGKSPNKYITIMIDEGETKIYGLNAVNAQLPVYVVEGPFDSTFIDNCVALCGSDGDVRCLQGSDLIFIYDNEPRNKEIVRRVGDTIDRGNKVVIWPSTIIEKDINDMVLSGHKVQDVIKSNTYSGLKAKLKFNEWKKV